MASGTLRGQELNSALEAMPLFMKAVAKEAGVSFGQIRKAGEEGKLTTDVMRRAFKSFTVEARETFEKYEYTVVGAAKSAAQEGFRIFDNYVVAFSGGQEAMQDETKGVVGIIMDLGDSLRDIAENF